MCASLVSTVSKEEEQRELSIRCYEIMRIEVKEGPSLEELDNLGKNGAKEERDVRRLKLSLWASHTMRVSIAGRWHIWGLTSIASHYYEIFRLNRTRKLWGARAKASTRMRAKEWLTRGETCVLRGSRAPMGKRLKFWPENLETPRSRVGMMTLRFCKKPLIPRAFVTSVRGYRVRAFSSLGHAGDAWVSQYTGDHYERDHGSSKPSSKSVGSIKNISNKVKTRGDDTWHTSIDAHKSTWVQAL